MIVQEVGYFAICYVTILLIREAPLDPVLNIVLIL